MQDVKGWLCWHTISLLKAMGMVHFGQHEKHLKPFSIYFQNAGVYLVCSVEGITLDSTPCSSSLEKNYRHQRSNRTQRLVPPLILKVESKVSASTGAVLQRFFHQRAASYADADRHPKNYSSAQMGMYMSKLQMWSITATTAHCAIGHRSQRCYIPQQQCAARHQVIINT